MASYLGVKSALLALEDFFKSRLPDELGKAPVSAQVKLFGSVNLADAITGNVLGIYLHRITIDSHGRSRLTPARGTEPGGQSSELPVNLHFLLIAVANSATIEADLMSWAMLELANDGYLDVAQLAEVDEDWRDSEICTITPEEMTTEVLMRIWDVFKMPYSSTVPYVARSVRLRLRPAQSEGPPVATRIFPVGRL